MYNFIISSAVSTLQKMSNTKLPFLSQVDFTAKNVHFDMILLTPSPTSEFHLHIIFYDTITLISFHK